MDNITAMCVSRLAKGRSRESIVAELVGLGMDHVSATKTVESTAHQLSMFTTDELKTQKRANGKATAIWGACMFALGLTVTFGTFLMAKSGGAYLLTFGLLIGGFAMFIKGLISMR